MKIFKSSLFFFCGLLLALQVTGCRNDENLNASSTDKEQPHKPGPGEGGGGDPDAQRFIFLSSKLARFYSENPSNLELPFSADDFSAAVARLDASLKDPAAVDLVSFTQAQLLDEDGVQKVALFDKILGTIQIHRPYWSAATDEDKFILINMEIAGLLGIDVRYEQALALVKDRAALIFAMPVAETGESTPIGWWLAHQDPNIFARISANDIVIDGGVIGTGSATNQRVVEFLANPANDQEWYSLAQQAFTQGLPAYLLLRDADGTRATLTAFRQTPNGFPTYTLLFFTKSKPVGQCEHNASELSTLERIKNCLFDTRFYQTGDMESVFSDLAQNLENHFAYSTEILETALQFFLIQDYTGIVTPQFRSYVLIKTVRAHGLTPTLGKNEIPFWERGSSINPQDLRFFKALERMAHDRMGFYPGQHRQCMYLHAGEMLNSTDEKPRIVPLNELHVMIQEDRCLLRNGDGFDGKFYRALAQHGYEYDDLTSEWTLRSPRTVSEYLIQSQFSVVNEIETKIITENLSPALSTQLIEQALDSSSLVQRLAIYDLLSRWQLLGLEADQATRLYRRALREMRQATQNPKADSQDLEWSIGSVYPLEQFVETSFQLAFNSRLISTEFSTEALREILQAPWLDARIAQNLLHASYRPIDEQNTNNFELALASMLNKPFLDVFMAQQIYSQLLEANSVNFKIRLEILTQLIDRGIAFTNEPQETLHTLERFRIGAELEQRSYSQSLTDEEEATFLVEAMRRSNAAFVVAPLVEQFLLNSVISNPTKRLLFEELMQVTLRDQFPAVGLRALAEMSFTIPMTPKQREDLYRFILLRFQNNEDDSARAHLMFEMQYVSRQSLDVLQGYQMLVELIAQTSQQKIGEVGLLPHLEEQDRTEARGIVRDIEWCRGADPSALCKYITSPNRILSLIALNPHLSVRTRQAAQLELRARH